MLLVSVWLTPTASYRNRVMVTEVTTRALEACNQKMVCGSVDKSQPESPSMPISWGFHAVLGNVVGMFVSGPVINPPRSGDPMSQLFVGGSAPEVSESRFA